MIYVIFLGKVTRNKKDKNNRKPPIYKQISIQALLFIFRFQSTLLLIMQINLIIKEQIKMDDIYQKSVADTLLEIYHPSTAGVLTQRVEPEKHLPEMTFLTALLL